MFFEPGTVYRDYWIETVLHTPFGEWALAFDEAKRKVYLQHVPLRKPAPQSLIEQYLSLDHPLLIPYWQVYQESKALVFVRPYVHVDGLIYRCPTDEETAGMWCDQLAQLETYLENQPIPMKIVYVPENIGVTAEGELRVFLCGDVSYMRLDFCDRETFRQALIDEGRKEDDTPEPEDSPSDPPLPANSRTKSQNTVRRRTAVLGIVIAGLLCFAAGLGLMNDVLSEEKPAPAQAESSRQTGADDPGPEIAPEPTPEAAPDPALSEDSIPPTQEDIDQSQTAAEEFVSSLDQDDHQNLLKKKARWMTVLPDMQAERVDSRPGEIIWDIEAEVFHSDGNMKGETYRTTFRVVTAKENGAWQVKDAEVLEEEKL